MSESRVFIARFIPSDLQVQDSYCKGKNRTEGRIHEQIILITLLHELDWHPLFRKA